MDTARRAGRRRRAWAEWVRPARRGLFVLRLALHPDPFGVRPY